MAYTVSTGGYDPKDTQRGPFVPLKVATAASAAITQTMLDNGYDACAISAEDSGTAVTGKGTAGLTGTDQIAGKVRYVSGDITVANSQDVPSYAMVEFAQPGTVLEFVYDSDNAPSIGNRAKMCTDASAPGKVQADGTKMATFVDTADTSLFKKVTQNRIIDIDTVNKKVKVLFDPFIPEPYTT